MKKLLIGVALLACGSITSPVFAADVTVKWQEPNNYTDINPAEQDKDKFEATLFRNFDDIFAGLARKMPDNYHWQITVTDLDLAGEVRPTQVGGRMVREIKTSYRPAITFHYRLTDAQNNLIKEDQVDIKDPTFMSRSPKLIGLNVKPYPYEEYMINQWFEQQQNQKILPIK